MAIVFQDMELQDEDQAEMAAPCISPGDKAMLPKFPWGLRVCLTEKEMAKLDLDEDDACVGGMIHGHFMARITSASVDQRQDGTTTRRVELQIEQLAIESEDDENEDADAAMDARMGRGKVLYDKD